MRGHLITHIQANVSSEKNTTHSIDNFNYKIQYKRAASSILYFLSTVNFTAFGFILPYKT